MAMAGGVFDTVCRKTVHQPMVFCCSRRNTDKSSCMTHVRTRPQTAPSQPGLTHVACLYAFNAM